MSHGESSAQPLSLYRPRLGASNHWLRVAPRTVFGAPARGAVVRPSTHPRIHPPTHPPTHPSISISIYARAPLPPLPHSLPPVPTTPPPHQVRLTAAGRTQLRVIDSGSGYLCQMEPVAHFGLGSVTEALHTACACACACARARACAMHYTMHRTMRTAPRLPGGRDRSGVARRRVCGAERERDYRHAAHRGLPHRQRRQHGGLQQRDQCQWRYAAEPSRDAPLHAVCAQCVHLYLPDPHGPSHPRLLCTSAQFTSGAPRRMRL